MIPPKQAIPKRDKDAYPVITRPLIYASLFLVK